MSRKSWCLEMVSIQTGSQLSNTWLIFRTLLIETFLQSCMLSDRENDVKCNCSHGNNDYDYDDNGNDDNS